MELPARSSADPGGGAARPRLPPDGLDPVVERAVAAERRIERERAGHHRGREDVLRGEEPVE